MRHILSVPLMLMAILVAGGPLGCNLFQPPEAPQLPQLKAPEVPETPDIEVPPPPDAPDIKAPDAPKVKGIDLPDGGNCCLRGGPNLGKICKGAERCCTDKYERSECEDGGGLWFNTTEGCAGAC